MWIGQKQWGELLTAQGELMKGLLEAQARNVELERHNSFLQTTLEWMRTRLNQVEHLQARVLEKQLDIPMVAPVVGRPFDFKDLLDSQADLFRDPEQAKFPENTE